MQKVMEQSPQSATGTRPPPSSLGKVGLSRLNDIGPTLVVVAILALAMQLGSYVLPPFVMPAPLTILAATWEILSTQMSHIGVTALRLFVAVVFAMTVGVLLGVVMGVIPRVRPYLQALVIIDTGIPALSWMLLAIFWFSEPEIRIFFILSVILIPFYALNIYDAIRALPRDWVDMIESFRPHRWQVLRYLVAPHIVPAIITTTKAVIGYAIRMAIFAELVASAIGIGSRMSLAQSMFRIDLVLGWTLILVIFNLGLQALINASEKLLLKWRPETKVR
ncbi:ABC transporter permease [Amorphus coralli]|uniref:ABC transporter permease n=1 Tax=Amorphus coralli TaxID=340680 RepID=UPI000366ABDB|nr:ABC transporter permease subunit [Amorphus coralli]